MYQQEATALDLFAGSGPILDLTTSSIGIEIDDKYYKLARDLRCDRIVEDQHRFEPAIQRLVHAIQDFEYTVFGP